MDLTDAGRTYYERALSLVREYDEMNQEVTDLEATPRGRLRACGRDVPARAPGRRREAPDGHIHANGSR